MIHHLFSHPRMRKRNEKFRIRSKKQIMIPECQKEFEIFQDFVLNMRSWLKELSGKVTTERFIELKTRISNQLLLWLEGNPCFKEPIESLPLGWFANKDRRRKQERIDQTMACLDELEEIVEKVGAFPTDSEQAWERIDSFINGLDPDVSTPTTAPEEITDERLKQLVLECKFRDVLVEINQSDIAKALAMKADEIFQDIPSRSLKRRVFESCFEDKDLKQLIKQAENTIRITDDQLQSLKHQQRMNFESVGVFERESFPFSCLVAGKPKANPKEIFLLMCPPNNKISFEDFSSLTTQSKEKLKLIDFTWKQVKDTQFKPTRSFDEFLQMRSRQQLKAFMIELRKEQKEYKELVESLIEKEERIKRSKRTIENPLPFLKTLEVKPTEPTKPIQDSKILIGGNMALFRMDLSVKIVKTIFGDEDSDDVVYEPDFYIHNKLIIRPWDVCPIHFKAKSLQEKSGLMWMKITPEDKYFLAVDLGLEPEPIPSDVFVFDEDNNKIKIVVPKGFKSPKSKPKRTIEESIGIIKRTISDLDPREITNLGITNGGIKTSGGIIKLNKEKIAEALACNFSDPEQDFNPRHIPGLVDKIKKIDFAPQKPDARFEAMGMNWFNRVQKIKWFNNQTDFDISLDVLFDLIE